MKKLRRLWNETGGQHLSEYVLILVLLALVAIAASRGLGQRIANVLGNATSPVVNSKLH